MRRFQWILLAFGAVLFVLMVRRTGASILVEEVRQVGWHLGGILLADLLIDVLHTRGWRRCFLPRARIVPALDLYLCRKAGVAMNTLTPTATLGGEGVKALLVQRWVPAGEAFAAVVTDKLTFALGQAVFLTVGLFALFHGVLQSPAQRATASVVMTLWLGGLLAFAALQRAGLLGRSARALRARFGDRLGGRFPERVAAIDERVSKFLRERVVDVIASLLLHAAAQTLRIAQFWFALRGLGFDPGLVVCFTMAAGFVFVEATFFFVPAKLGVFEGGNLLVFTMLGFDAQTGLAVALALRISELVALLPGLAAFLRYGLRPADRRGGSEPGPPGGVSGAT